MKKKLSNVSEENSPNTKSSVTLDKSILSPGENMKYGKIEMIDKQSDKTAPTFKQPR